MPTERQIDAQIKLDTAQVSRDIIGHVTGTALRILHEQNFYNSHLWPKDGINAMAITNLQKDDVVEVIANVSDLNESVIVGSIRLNLFNISYDRVIQQFQLIRLLLHSAIDNDVYFEFVRTATVGIRVHKTFGQMDFNFTYTPDNLTNK